MTNYINTPEQLAEIQAIQHQASGLHWVEFKWIGSPRLPGFAYLENKTIWGDNWEKLPWPVIELGREHLSTRVFLMRVDGANWFSACWERYKVQTRHIYFWWMARVLMTAKIWGWADIKEGDFLSWRCLKLPGILKRKVK